MNKDGEIRTVLTENWGYFTTKIRNGEIDITSIIPNYKQTWTYFSELIGKGTFSVDDIKLINAIHRFSSELTEAARYIHYEGEDPEVISRLFMLAVLIYKLLDNITDQRFSDGMLRLEIFGKKIIIFPDGFDLTYNELCEECLEKLKQGQEDFL